MVEQIEKHKVAQSFSRAAKTYDSVAGLQRDIGHQLLSRLQDQHLVSPPQRILDLGSGTGYFTAELACEYPVSDIVALDLAEGMLRYSREHRQSDQITWLCADAESLPLRSGSIDLVFSSLAIQWCQNTDALFSELSRVLSPGGLACIATLGPETLCELRDAWALVDGFQHVNQFAPLSELQASLPAGLEVVSMAEETEVLEYDELKGLTKELKDLGAHNMSQNQSPGLTGPGRLKAFRAAYETFRNRSGKLPASYDVYYLLLKKS